MTLNALWCIILRKRENIFLFTFRVSHIRHDANITCRDNTSYGLFTKTTYSVIEDKDEKCLKIIHKKTIFLKYFWSIIKCRWIYFRYGSQEWSNIFVFIYKPTYVFIYEITIDRLCDENRLRCAHRDLLRHSCYRMIININGVVIYFFLRNFASDLNTVYVCAWLIRTLNYEGV